MKKECCKINLFTVQFVSQKSLAYTRDKPLAGSAGARERFCNEAGLVNRVIDRSVVLYLQITMFTSPSLRQKDGNYSCI